MPVSRLLILIFSSHHLGIINLSLQKSHFTILGARLEGRAHGDVVCDDTKAKVWHFEPVKGGL